MSTSTPNIDAMEQMGKMLSLVGKVVGDYRKALVEGGMSDELADQLAVDLNSRLMDQSFAKAKTPPDEARQTMGASLVESFQRKNGG